MPKNLLLETASESVFSGTLTPQVLKTWAEVNAQIDAKIVPRSEYEESKKSPNASESISRVTLPEDLTFGECLEVIKTLEQCFGLTDTPHSTSLVYKVKVLIALLYRNGSISTQDIEELIEAFSLNAGDIDLPANQEVQELLLSCYISHSDTKNLERIYRERIRGVILLSLLSTFTSYGAQMLLKKLTTFTRDEYDTLHSQITSGEISGEILDVFQCPEPEKKEVKIKTKQYHHFPSALSFSHKIRLELFMQKLESARETGDTQEVASFEFTAASILAYELYQYPWLASGSQAPGDILKHKKMSCLGYSLVGSAVLKKLGIKHTSMISKNHIFLLVEIGGGNYIFDPTRSTMLVEVSLKPNVKQSYDILVGEDIESFYVRNADTEIPANIFVNLASQAHRNGQKNDALAYLEVSQLINPLSPITYYNKAGILLALDRPLEAIPLYFMYLSFIPNCHTSLNNIAHIFRLQKDYEKALSYVLQSLIMQAFSSTTWQTLGEVLAGIGKKDAVHLCEYVGSLIAKKAQHFPEIDVGLQEQIKNLLEEEDFFSILSLILGKEAMEAVATQIEATSGDGA